MFNFTNLDDQTRSYMLQAIEEAERDGQIYYSVRFNSAGKEQWLSLLEEASREHDAQWLAEELEGRRLMKGLETSERPVGGYSIRHVPEIAAQTFAEGQFNRFYMLGLCRRAKAAGIPALEVYRAKDVELPRPGSDLLVGTRIPIPILEEQLRDVQNSFKSMLILPNSGLSLRMPLPAEGAE
jgi:hypothetical protein